LHLISILQIDRRELFLNSSYLLTIELKNTFKVDFVRLVGQISDLGNDFDLSFIEVVGKGLFDDWVF